MCKRHLLFVFLCLWGQRVAGQQNCFYAVGYLPTAPQVRVCVGRPITMNDAACVNFAPDPTRLYKFSPSMVATPSKTHTYTQPGVYTVELIGNVPAPGTGNISTVRQDYVVVLPTPKPKVKLTRCSNRQLKIEILEFAPYDRYKVELGNNVTQYITASTNPFTYVYATSGNYTIKIEGEHALLNLTNDYCSGVNADTTITNLLVYDNLSDIATTFQINQEDTPSVCEGKIKITIPQVFADIRYEIYFSTANQPAQILRVFENQSQQNVSYTLEKLNTLGESHTVLIRLKDKCGNQYDFVQVVPPAVASFPVEVQKLNASFDLENKLQISWQTPLQAFQEIRTYQILENTNIVLQTSENQVFLEGKDKTRQCYSVSFTTSCGVKTLFSKPVCPIILQVSSSGFNSRTLQWNAYRNSDNEVVSYRILKLNAEKVEVDNFTAGSQLSYVDSNEDLENQVIYYRIKAVTPSGEYFSNLARVERPAQIFFPNAFTPNGDGLNDTFFAKGVFIKNFEMAIFTPNGQEIFRTQSMAEKDGWNGEFQGKPMPQGIYIFQCTAEDFIGKRLQYSGTVLLQR